MLNEAVLPAEHVGKINSLTVDKMQTEALWLITSKSRARALDFDTRVVKPGGRRCPDGRGASREDETNMRDTSVQGNHWTRAKLPTALGGLGLRSAEALKDIAYAVTAEMMELQTKELRQTWRAEREKSDLPAASEDAMEKSHGVLSVRRKRPREWHDAGSIQGRLA